MIRRAATLAVLAALCFLRNANCEAQAVDDERLAEIVVTTALSGAGRSTEGTVVARFEDKEKGEPLQVWILEKKVLRDGSKKDLERAFGSNRKKWPPYTVLYTVSPGDADKYQVEVSIYYDMGLLPDSRGGFSERWTVAHENGRWTVLDQKTMMHWD